MATEKRTVTLEPEVARAVQALAAEERISFSAWLNEAARRQISRHRAAAYGRWEAEHCTASDMAEADAATKTASLPPTAAW